MLRVLALIGASALALPLCFAQQAAQNNATAQLPAEEAHSSLLVTVLCSDTNKAARGAMVYISKDRKGSSKDEDADDRHTSTDGDGHAVFEGLRPGEYSILAELYGYIRGARREPSMEEWYPTPVLQTETPQSHVTVNRGQRSVSTITLLRGAVLSGQVLYDDGSPGIRTPMLLEDASIKIGDPTRDDLNPTHRITTADLYGYKADDRGNFRIAGLPPGTYRIAALPNLQDQTRISGMQGAFAVFSEETLHRAAAKTYEVHAGEEASGIQIIISLSQLHRVKGVVTTTEGLPINQGDVMLTDNTDATIRLHADLEESGGFSFGSVPSGAYTLTVSYAFRTKPKQAVAPDYDNKEKTNAFAQTKSSIIVGDSDLMDLHFELKEIPLPPEKPEAADSPSLP